MKSVTRNPRVESDLKRISTYIADSNPEAARRFLAAAEETFQFLLSHPEAGPARPFRPRRLAKLRSWRVPGFENYLIFYRVVPMGVELVRIIYGARDLERRLSKRE